MSVPAPSTMSQTVVPARGLRPDSRLPLSLRVFFSVFVTVTALCAVVTAFTRFVLHYPHPFRTPFIPTFQNHRFVDFFDFYVRFTHYHHLDFFSQDKSRGAIFSYPAPVGLLYAFFYLPPDHRYVFFTVITVALSATLVVLLARAMLRRGLAPATTAFFLLSVSLLSYPFWFNFFLGNTEIAVFLILAFGVVAHLRRHFFVAAALIGVAGSMKIFPLVLFGLFLARKQYRAMALGVFATAATYIFALWMECPSLTVARRGMAGGADAMKTGLILKWLPVENGFDHSLFSTVKTIFHAQYHDLFPSTALTAYVLAAAIGGTMLFFLRIRHLPLLNQILSLYLAAVLLPPMSHHYTLMQLYVPWALLVLFALDSRFDRLVPGLTAALVCLALIFAPESEFIFHGATLSGPIKTCVLCVLWAVALIFPFQWQRRAVLAGDLAQPVAAKV